jgi:hypothetical protein
MLLLCLVAVVALAANKSEYQKGVLIDLRRTETDAGALRAQGSFCVAVRIDDISYLSRYEAAFRWSYAPTDFVVGDPVDVKVKGNHLYIRRAKGGDLKTDITRRQRIAANGKPMTCSAPVTQN